MNNPTPIINDQPHGEPLQPTNASLVDAPQGRIVLPRKELAETGLQLACSKTSKGNLKLHPTTDRMGSPLNINEDTVVRHNTNTNQENSPAPAIVIAVPTKHPFSRKNIIRRKILNPGSCSSAMDLLGLSQLYSNGTNMIPLHCAKRASTAVLDPNSCDASSRNTFLGLQVQGLFHSSSSSNTLPVSPGVSASSLLQINQENDSSYASVSLGNNFALLFGNGQILPSSLSRRDSDNNSSSSKNNARLGRKMKNGGTKRNADWDAFA